MLALIAEVLVRARGVRANGQLLRSGTQHAANLGEDRQILVKLVLLLWHIITIQRLVQESAGQYLRNKKIRSAM